MDWSPARIAATTLLEQLASRTGLHAIAARTGLPAAPSRAGLQEQPVPLDSRPGTGGAGAMGDAWHRPLLDVGDGHVIAFSDLIVTALVLFVGILLSRVLADWVAQRLRRQERLDTSAVEAVRRALFYALSLGTAMIALQTLGIPLTMFAFLGGALAIGVGFGAQNIIGNFISGWILMTERPLRIDDLIEVEGHRGRVESIGARSTRIRRLDGIDIIVPNSALLDSTVVNWTLFDRNIRTSVKVGVAYGSPTALVAELLGRAIEGQAGILDDPPPRVLFADFGDNALVFEVFFWCHFNTHMELRQIRSDVRFRIDELLGAAGIAIAFPQRDVHLDMSHPLEVRVIDSTTPPPAP